MRCIQASCFVIVYILHNTLGLVYVELPSHNILRVLA